METFWWAKTNKKGEYHLLIYHLLDVAASTNILFWHVLTKSERDFLMQEFQASSHEEACNIFCFLAALHDIGKLTPIFEGNKPSPKHPYRVKSPIATTLAGIIQKNGYSLNSHFAWHGQLTAGIFIDELHSYFSSKMICKDIAKTLGGHHGQIIKNADSYKGLMYLGNSKWAKAREEVVGVLTNLFNIKAPLKLAALKARTFSYIAGLTSVADWIGSNETFFHFKDQLEDFGVYFFNAKEHALDFIRSPEVNWEHTPIKFDINSILENRKPYEIQKKCIKLLPKLDRQFMVIVESNTGGGKTEASEIIAYYAVSKLDLRGVYNALPTIASSNQQFCRLNPIYKALGGKDVKAVHSQSVLFYKQMEKIGKIKRKIRDWFVTGKKRGLLAPVAVGSVDQLLLSSMGVNHFFVRQFGIANKVVVLDEVHAYDTFMYYHLENLLKWLKVLGCSVVILSATLPNEKKRALMEAFSGKYVEAKTYPNITWAYADGTDAGVIALKAHKKDKVHVSFLSRDIDALIASIEAKTHRRGCICVYVNYIKRAKEIARKLRKHFSVATVTVVKTKGEADRTNIRYSKVPITLLDTRFLNKQRYGYDVENNFGTKHIDGIEEKIINMCGKKNGKTAEERGTRPEFRIIVCTQVLEQSMDLDFDLIYSDLCPGDMLIQRGGRLWRHFSKKRPFAHSEIVIMMPEMENGLPKLDFWEFVPYEHYWMWRSWYAVTKLCKKYLPHEKKLVEAVYSAQLPQIRSKKLLNKILEAKTTFETVKSGDHQDTSKMHVKIDAADEVDFDGLEERDENKVILTRKAWKNVLLVCYKDNFLWDYKDDDKNESLILENSVKISMKGIVQCVEDNAGTQGFPVFRPSSWKKNPVLKNYYLAKFDKNGKCEIDDGTKSYVLGVSDFYGVTVFTKKK